MTRHPDLPIVAHSVNPYLPRSGSWIYSQLTGLERYRGMVITTHVQNLETFPFEEVYARDDLNPLGAAYQKLHKRYRRSYMPYHKRALEQKGARLLHSHFGVRAYEDVELKEDVGIPQVSSFYGADIWKRATKAEWRDRYADLFQRSERFLVEGPAMRAKVMDLGCPSEKVVVHHLGVDLGKIAFTPRKVTGGEVRFLAAGRAVEKKGHDFAVRAFAKVHRRNPNTHLGMILIKPDRHAREAMEPIERAIREERMEDAVKIYDYMPYDEYLAALASYHILLAPSRHASDGDAEGGFPVTITEMLAAGMTVVGSDHCDIPSIVRDRETGRLFPEGDMDAMVEAMLELCDEQDSWEKLARTGRALVEDEWDVATQNRALEDVYDGMLARELSPAGERA